jgi:hypothetical protein
MLRINKIRLIPLTPIVNPWAPFMAASHQLSTRQLLAKIPNIPCLYRYELNAIYYGIKRTAGKRKEHNLQITDKRIAKRKLAEWVKGLDEIDANAEKTRLDQLLEKFVGLNAGKSESTQATKACTIKRLKGEWKCCLDIPVSKIKPSLSANG